LGVNFLRRPTPHSSEFSTTPSGLSASLRVKARSRGGPDTLSGAKQAHAVGVWGNHDIGPCHRTGQTVNVNRGWYMTRGSLGMISSSPVFKKRPPNRPPGRR
jgi:hypothetical protein